VMCERLAQEHDFGLLFMQFRSKMTDVNLL